MLRLLRKRFPLEPYSAGSPTDFDVPALVAVAGVLVVAAATKVGYPLWAIGGMVFLYVLSLGDTAHEPGPSPLGDRRWRDNEHVPQNHSAPAASTFALDLWLVVQNHVRQGIMDFQFSIVFDKTQFAEFVHEKAHAWSRRANHLRQGFLTKISHDRLRPAFLAEICKEKEQPGEAFFARIEQLADQVLFNSTAPIQQVRHEQLENSGSLWMVAIMVAFSRRVITGSSIALVVAMRSGWPFSLLLTARLSPSPK
jgi:hypothetical protein